LHFPVVDRNSKLDRLAADLTVFNVSLVTPADIDENIEALSAVGTLHPSGCFHMLPPDLQRIALTITLAVAGLSCFSALPQNSLQNPPAQGHEWSRWIELAREVALQYSDSLPDFICAQTTRRYSSTSDAKTWQAEDVWEAELSFNQRVERYSKVRRNGKASRKPLESLGGALSIGEFGSLLRTLFVPETQTEFWKEGEELFQETPSIVAGFKVSQERSRWALSFENSHSLNVAYRGRIWIDASNHQVLKISQQAQNLPARFPITYSEATIVYGYVIVAGLEGKRFLLPQSASLILHERERRVRSLNIMEFRNYRKFTADVRLVPE
jgi:hypothetical protein